MEDWHRAITSVLETGAGMEMVFQPIVRLDGRRRAGFEALARFPSPRIEELRAQTPEVLDSNTIGIGPDLWFRAASMLGLQSELETLAVRLALARLGDVPARSYLAVNCAPATVTHPPLLEELVRHPLRRIVLEITESDPVERADYGPLLEAVAPLRRSGATVCLRVAVDDVGAGASMSHVVELDADVVKLDLSLTRGIDRSAKKRALVKGFVGFAQVTGAVVVAEGIETEAEISTLLALEVSHGQGYLLGRPGPLPEGRRR